MPLDFNMLADQAADAGNVAANGTIKKEMLHYDILLAMHAAGLLERLVFKGGTSLRLCHGSPRLSEDLDFSGGARFSPSIFDGFEEVLAAAIHRRYGLRTFVKPPSAKHLDMPVRRDEPAGGAKRPPDQCSNGHRGLTGLDAANAGNIRRPLTVAGRPANAVAQPPTAQREPRRTSGRKPPRSCGPFLAWHGGRTDRRRKQRVLGATRASTEGLGKERSFAEQTRYHAFRLVWGRKSWRKNRASLRSSTTAAPCAG